MFLGLWHEIITHCHGIAIYQLMFYWGREFVHKQWFRFNYFQSYLLPRFPYKGRMHVLAPIYMPTHSSIPFAGLDFLGQGTFL